MFTKHKIVDGFPGKSDSHGSFGWSSVWLFRQHKHVVLIDTGPPGYIPLLQQRLADLHLAPNDVTDVVLTHAHWDHIGNVGMFPEATKWIGDSELEWAAGLPADTPFVSTAHVRELLCSNDLKRIKSGKEILPGISSIATPGHTPGHLSYLISMHNGHAIFAGDAIKNLHELASLQADLTMDAQASRNSIKNLRNLMRVHEAILIPGHDVPLRFDGTTATRIYRQSAQISFFADAMEQAEDRSISADLPSV